MAEPTRRRLVLASASPFRRRMLEAAGLSFEVAPADVDEAALKRDLLRSGSTPSPSRRRWRQRRPKPSARVCPTPW